MIPFTGKHPGLAAFAKAVGVNPRTVVRHKKLGAPCSRPEEFIAYFKEYTRRRYQSRFWRKCKNKGGGGKLQRFALAHGVPFSELKMSRMLYSAPIDCIETYLGYMATVAEAKKHGRFVNNALFVLERNGAPTTTALAAVAGWTVKYTRNFTDQHGEAFSCAEDMLGFHETVRLHREERQRTWDYRKANPIKPPSAMPNAQRAYRQKNPDKLRRYKQKYMSKPENRAKLSARRKRRMDSDPHFKARARLSNRLYQLCRGLHISKPGPVMSFVGCSQADLMKWIERQFTRGMAWNNYGKWHIDHIIPCCKFDLTNPVQVALCFHFSNLRPMWARDNISKGGRLDIHRPLPLLLGA